LRKGPYQGNDNGWSDEAQEAETGLNPAVVFTPVSPWIQEKGKEDNDEGGTIRDSIVPELTRQTTLRCLHNNQMQMET